MIVLCIVTKCVIETIPMFNMNISIVIDKIDHILDSLKKKILFSVSLLTLYGSIVLFLLTGELMAIQIISLAKVCVQ